jgi:hypothetical protein
MTSDLAARALWVAGCLAVAGCADLSRGPERSDGAPTASDDGGAGASDTAAASADAALFFGSSVHGLLVAACQSCHAAGEQAGDTTYLLTGDVATDYATVSLFINLGAPASSRLLTKMSGNGHGGGTVYAASAPEYQTILQWIREGAAK